MELNQKNPNQENVRQETGNSNRYTASGNNKLIIGLVAALVLTSIIILTILLSGPSNYEKGLQYIHQKQYTEALVEFQKVEPGDKDFNMSQSKINYINGLQSYNNGLYPQAQLFLAKVDPADEYYRESQLMLDKMNLAKRQGGLESLSDKINSTTKDTVIIKEKIVESSPDKVNSAEPNVSNDENVNMNYIVSLDALINKFNELYTSALNQNAASRFKTMRLMDSIYAEAQNLNYKPRENNAMIMELKSLKGEWMQKAMTHINSLTPENSVGGESNAIKYKDEVQQQYTLMTNLLKKIKSSL